MAQINGINNERLKWEAMRRGYISPKTLSDYLDIPISTIRTWISKKSIPFKKVGFLIRFDLQEIHQWIEGNNSSFSKKITLKESNNEEIQK
ncbi:MAG: excisionase family DNA-binding protein [Elusimicrobiota bacterium]